MRTYLKMAIALVTVFGAARQASAAPHILIDEVVTGLWSNSQVQYVVLRMWAGTEGGGAMTGYTLYVRNSSGIGIGRLSIDAEVPNGHDGATILIANQAAATFFNITPDFLYSGEPIPQSGELEVVTPQRQTDDLFMYGSVTDPQRPLHQTSYDIYPFNPAGGIPKGMVAQRYRDTSDPNSNRSRDDFCFSSTPWPLANDGVLGAVSAATCGNGQKEAFEQCDNGAQNGLSGNACTAQCRFSVGNGGGICGDSIVTNYEGCDDGNVADGDGCSALCLREVGSLFVCGNNVIEPLEYCDNGAANGRGNNPCAANCRWATPGSTTTTGGAPDGNSPTTTGGTPVATTTGGAPDGNSPTTTGGTPVATTTGGAPDANSITTPNGGGTSNPNTTTGGGSAPSPGGGTTGTTSSGAAEAPAGGNTGDDITGTVTGGITTVGAGTSSTGGGSDSSSDDAQTAIAHASSLFSCQSAPMSEILGLLAAVALYRRRCPRP